MSGSTYITSVDSAPGFTAAGTDVTPETLDDSFESHSLALASLGDDTVSQSTRLHHKIRKLKSMDTVLMKTKASYGERLRKVRMREQRFHRKQQDIIDHLRRFRPFVQETDNKCRRAEKKYKAECEYIETTLRERHAELKAELAKKLRLRARMINRYRSVKVHESFLESVLLHTTEFADIDDLLKRHEILSSTLESLNQRNVQVQSSLTAAHQKWAAGMKEKRHENLVKTSELAVCSKRLEEITSRVSAAESVAASAEQRALLSKQEFYEIRMSVQNIHKFASSRKSSVSFRKRMSEPPKSASQVEVATYLHNLLNAAAEDITDLTDIICTTITAPPDTTTQTISLQSHMISKWTEGVEAVNTHASETEESKDGEQGFPSESKQEASEGVDGAGAGPSSSQSTAMAQATAATAHLISQGRNRTDGLAKCSTEAVAAAINYARKLSYTGYIPAPITKHDRRLPTHVLLHQQRVQQHALSRERERVAAEQLLKQRRLDAQIQAQKKRQELKLAQHLSQMAERDATPTPQTSATQQHVARSQSAAPDMHGSVGDLTASKSYF